MRGGGRLSRGVRGHLPIRLLWQRPDQHRVGSENQNQRSFVALECQFFGGASLLHSV